MLSKLQLYTHARTHTSVIDGGLKSIGITVSETAYMFMPYGRKGT